MPRDDVRIVVVKKWVTFLLLIVMTVAMLGITLSLSGHTYRKVDAEPFRDVKRLVHRLTEGPTPFPVVVALVTPIVLNVLLFMPWGFLMFVLLDRPTRATSLSYLLTILLAIALSLGVEAWQYFLPTRVTDVNDVIWNAAGAAVGAVFGHLRKRVRIAFV
jgi:glycopeptide antibiotics resistance protein